MTRCPQCGALMVVGGSCRACAMASGGDPSAGGSGHGAPPSAYTSAAGPYGASADGRGAPAYGGAGQGWASYGAAPAAPVRGTGKKASPVLIVVGLIVLLLVAAVGVLVFTAGGEEAAPPIPGWQLMEGGGVSIQLPLSFKGGNPAADPEAVAEQLRAMGGDYQALQEWVRMSEDAVLLIAADTASSTPGLVSNVNVIAEKVPSSISMEEYVASGVSQVPPMFEVQESGVVTIGSQRAGRLVTRFQAADGQPGMQLLYAFKEGGTVHVVTFTTSAREWGSRLPVFEQSAATFRQ